MSDKFELLDILATVATQHLFINRYHGISYKKNKRKKCKNNINKKSRVKNFVCFKCCGTDVNNNSKIDGRYLRHYGQQYYDGLKARGAKHLYQ